MSIEDSVYFDIEIGNTGLSTLAVQNIYSLQGNILVNAALPLNITGMNQTQIPLTFIPNEIGSIEDTLVIISNDPINPVYKIPFAAFVQNYFIIVDNNDTGVYSETGSWFTSVVQAYGPSSRYAYIQSTPNGPTASFTFSINKNGYYDIYEIIPTTENSANNAFYKIISNDVVIDSFYQNQNQGSGSWKYFGRYYLNANVPIVLKVIDSGESTAGPVIRADAFKIALYDETSDADDHKQETIPNDYALYQNYPNPFNPGTSIRYAIGSRQFVSLKVYDVLGNEVAVLVNAEKSAGNYEVNFSATGGASQLSSGIYFYKLTAGSFTETKKMLLLK